MSTSKNSAVRMAVEASKTKQRTVEGDDEYKDMPEMEVSTKKIVFFPLLLPFFNKKTLMGRLKQEYMRRVMRICSLRPTSRFLHVYVQNTLFIYNMPWEMSAGYC